MTGGCSLVVLAGGQSRRMGRDKATLPAGSQTLLERIIARLGPAFDEVIVASGAGVSGLGAARVVPDQFSAAGPLAGIHAGLRASAFQLAWVVACDYPDLSPAIGSRLLDAVAGFDAAVPRIGGQAQGVCAVYRVQLASLVERLIVSGRRSVASLLDSCAVRYLEEAELAGSGALPASFLNLNTQAEYEAWVSAKPSPW